ncbi:MAG: hypothetical protein KGY45_03440 [Hadesarchaea archaeon]|nr:hypothetical protein [Hadesarchaea archaeon]
MTKYEDLKVYGRVGLSEEEAIVVKKTKVDTYTYYDIRKFINSKDPNGYTGPTKKGLTINAQNLDTVKKLKDCLEKLIEVEEKKEEKEEKEKEE